MQFDLLLRGGEVMDGTGAPGRTADVGVTAGRIEAIGDLSASTAAETVDVTGKVVAPGFIDIHSHSDFVIPLEDHHETLSPFLSQGITTIVTGNCGFSPAPTSPALVPYLEMGGDMLSDRPLDYGWSTMGEFLDSLDMRGVALNVAQLVGHGIVKLALGDDIDEMKKVIGAALDEGAVGVSAGLGYAPGMFASTEELTAVTKEAAARNKPFTCHARAYTWVAPNVIEPTDDDHHVAAIRELLTVAQASAVPLQISHLMFAGEKTWSRAEPVFELLEKASGEVEYAMDMFPYTGGNTTIRIALPPWIQDNPEEQLQNAEAREQVRNMLITMEPMVGISPSDIRLLYAASEEYAEFEGQTFDQIGDDPYEAYIDVVIASRGRALIMIHKYSGTEADESLVHRVFELPDCAVGADTILTKKGFGNPASYGCFPKVLGSYVRDRKLFSLEEAVRRMTSLPAERMRLADRGRIASGFAADLVVFDPSTVDGTATFGEPSTPPVGIENVYLNGVAVVDRGVASPKKVGTVIRT